MALGHLRELFCKHDIEERNRVGHLFVGLIMCVIECLRLEVQSEVPLVTAREPPSLGAVTFHLSQPRADCLCVAPHAQSSKYAIAK